MSPLALSARTGPLLAVLALWLQVLGGGVLPALRAGSVIVAPLCHAADGRVKPVLPAHLDDCDSCVLCTAPAQGATAAVVPVPGGGGVATTPAMSWAEVPPARRVLGHGPRGPPVS